MRVLLTNRQQAHAVVNEAYVKIKEQLQAGKRLVLTLTEETRSNEQNAKMWATLGEIANQVDWYGQKLTAEEWKWVLSASLKKQRAVQGIDGGFVVLGQSTSKMAATVVVTAPVAVVADVVTLGGALTDKDKPYTAEALGDFVDNLKNATNPDK